jgi:hypothetical protein
LFLSATGINIVKYWAIWEGLNGMKSVQFYLWLV